MLLPGLISALAEGESDEAFPGAMFFAYRVL